MSVRPIIHGDDRSWRPPSAVDPKPTPGQAAAVRRLCTRHATGPDDLRDLLQVLGLQRRERVDA